MGMPVLQITLALSKLKLKLSVTLPLPLAWICGRWFISRTESSSAALVAGSTVCDWGLNQAGARISPITYSHPT